MSASAHVVNRIDCVRRSFVRSCVPPFERVRGNSVVLVCRDDDDDDDDGYVFR